MYKISVIIPVYNAEKTLPKTLKSTVDQSLSDIEIICVDDGSTDQSSKIIKEWQAAHPNIRSVRQQNGGAGSARNSGMDIAAGTYLSFIDADDTYPDDHALEALYQAAESQRAFVCGGSAVYAHREHKTNQCIFTKAGWMKFSDYQYDTLFGRFICNREFINRYQLRFPELKIYEDPVFLSRVLIAAETFYAIPDPVYGYHGPHQVQEMTREKAGDYLTGLRMELLLSSKHQLPKLHQLAFKRLVHEACYYAEPFLYADDYDMLALLLKTAAALDHSLISLDENYLLPTIVSLCHAAGNYMRLYRSAPVKWERRLIRKLHTGFKGHECQKKYL